MGHDEAVVVTITTVARLVPPNGGERARTVRAPDASIARMASGIGWDDASMRDRFSSEFYLR